ncbi:hypothetical protein [Flavobacterium sp. C4GT6]|uniref:hypothetical protein n=1 Tax=Flavobacterium sp. C4GT6 TaxID=3103818 RepID=UPI002ED379BB
MKKHLTILFLIIVCSLGYSQTKKESFFKNAYISGEYIFRSYGTGDMLGLGGGAEISKDIKKWLGVGLNLSYWDNTKLEWDFDDPYTGQRQQFYGRIREFKVTPFVQLMPINTKYFDLIVYGGVRTGYYHQNIYNGSYYSIYDVGNKNVTLGYEFGPALRFQIEKLIIVPSMIIGNDTNGDSFNQLSVKVGWQL